MKTQSATCYQDSTEVLTTKARAALLESAGRDWTAAQEAAKEAGALEIKALNLLRTAGLKLIEAAGHEQVTFEFLRQNRAHLPADLGFNAVKFCVHLCRNFEKEIKSLDEARAARRALFEAFTLETVSKRTEAQSARETPNPWNQFVSGASSFTALFSKLQTDAMNDWSRDKLSCFARETKPIAEAHTRAVQLLGK